ncbi:hypothetical protein HN451_03095, partial [archaeon]|nr:hypothetical protein [archaeon]
MANLELILSDMENTTSDGTIKHHYVLTTWDFEGDSKEYYSWHGLHRGTIKHISISTDTEKFDFREDNVFRLDENYKPKIYPRGALEFILENLAKSNNKIYDVSGDGVGLGIGSTVIDKELFDYLMDNNLLERDLRRMGFDGKITDRLKKEDNNLESLFGSIFSDLSKFQVYRGQKKSKVNTYKDIEDVFDREINSLQEIGLGNTFSEGITHIRFMYDNKDYVFKIHKEKERAKKEIWTANEARKNPILAPYIAAPETDEIFEHDGHFITLWRHASKPTGKEILEVKEKDIFKEKSY